MEKSRPVTVTGRDGLYGVIETVSEPSAEEKARALVRLEDGQAILVPVDAFELRKDGSFYLPLSQADVEQYRIQGNVRDSDAVVVIPVLVEELDVYKRRITTGKVRLSKVVHEREEVIDEPLMREQIEVERVPINRVIDQPLSVHYDDDTLVVPLVEEVLVVEKRLLLKEEVRISKWRMEAREPRHVTLRSEDVLIERQESQDGEAAREHGH